MRSWSTTSRDLGLALVLALAVAGSARAQDGFLKLGEIGGEAQGEGHQDWIELIHVDLDPQGNTLTAEAGMRRSLRFSKRIDKASPLIQQALAKNERFPEVTLRVRKGGGSQEYLEIKLENVIISSYQTGGPPDRPTESFSLNFTKITYNYPEKKLAGPAGPVAEGQADNDRPIVLGRVYNDPTPVDLLEPKGIEAIAESKVRAATVELPEGALAMALREAFDKGETLDELSLSVRSAAESSPYSPGSTKYTTIKLARVRVTGISPGDRYGRVKVQLHWDRAEVPASGPVIGPRTGNLASNYSDDSAGKQEVAGRTSPSMQNDALSAARFSITVDGVEIASFSELAGINSSVEPVEFVLRRGKATGPAIWAWHEAVQTGNMAAARKSASLVMYDYDGKPVASYHLESAWPAKIEIGGLKAQGNLSDLEFLKTRASRGGEVAMETVTIVSEHIQRVAQ